MVVYDIGRQKLGNTTINTVAVWPVRIESVDTERRVAVARWNGNSARLYGEHAISKWQATKPLLIRSAIGSQRLATRDEIKAAKANAKSDLSLEPKKTPEERS